MHQQSADGLDDMDIIMSQMDDSDFKDKSNANKKVVSINETDANMKFELIVDPGDFDGTKSFDEKVVMAYFNLASQNYKPSTLWSIYSMLKKTFICKHNLDMTKYCRLRAFLKTKFDGYVPKKSNVFTSEEIQKFIVEAPNCIYLAMKVVLIFGVNGTCRIGELTNLTLKDYKDDGKEIRVLIPDTKTKVPKEYLICGEFAKIIRQYVKMRPSHAKTNRLFLQWRNGKCVNQVMGKHSIAKIPKEVAKFLNLPEPSSHTGHSYRRTSTTIAADEGSSFEELKRIGLWKSTKVCEGYIQDSMARKRKVAEMFSRAINLPSNGTADVDDAVEKNADIIESEGNIIPTPVIVASSSQIAISGADGTGSEKIALRRQNRSQSELTFSSSGKQFMISGSDKSDSLPGKENIIFHFGDKCSNFTIVNMK